MEKLLSENHFGYISLYYILYLFLLQLHSSRSTTLKDMKEINCEAHLPFLKSKHTVQVAINYDFQQTFV